MFDFNYECLQYPDCIECAHTQHNTTQAHRRPRCLHLLPDLHLPDEIWPFPVLNDLNEALADAEGGVLIEAPLT